MFMRHARAAAVVAVVLLAGFGAQAATAQQTAAIASGHPLATAAGHAILERGGNGFDAAVAIAAALAVVEPHSSGLGGGGFFLLHRAADQRQIMVDARETAPSGITRVQFFDSDGQPIAGATTRGGTAAAIPGLAAGLVHIAQRYGRLPLTQSLAPAVRLARDGFPVDIRYARIAKLRERFLQTGVNTDVFLDRGQAPEQGFILRQSALAVTLDRLARFGTAGFYKGPVARALVDAVNRAGGVWRSSDLENYRIVEREPLRFRYRGALITAASLPSAGGIVLAQTFGMLQRFSLGNVGEPATDHVVIEALRRAFQDRARYLGDPDFVSVPIERLTSIEYAHGRAADIELARATRSDALGEQRPARAESHNTTHFSVVDSDGNRIAATLTLNSFFGAGLVAAPTGVALNNEMGDFNLRADVPDAYRLRGGLANAIAPGKRPLSSMTPTFVEDDRGVLVLGSTGGSRIASQVVLVILEYLRTPEVDFQRLLRMPRYHHQYWPDRVEVEPEGFTPEWRAVMAAQGHTIETVRRLWGNMQLVFKSKHNGFAQAESDPRGEGIAWY